MEPGTGMRTRTLCLNAGKQDGFNLDAVDIKIAKPQDTTDVRRLCRGTELWPGRHAIDGGAAPIRQAYVALHMPIGNGIDWSWDAGTIFWL